MLVPLSMLNLPFSSNLNIVQNTNSESQLNLVQSSAPSSETRLMSSSNVRKSGPRRYVAERKTIPHGKYSGKLLTVKNSNNQKDERGRGKKENMVKRKRNACKNTRNNHRQTSYKKDGNGLKAKYDLRKIDRRNDSALCLVCGEKAGQHTYYGGKSCQSCRAFFRRSVHIITRFVLTSLLLKM